MAATPYMLAKIRINYDSGQGWTEKYALNTTDYPTAKTLLLGLCQYRALCLAGRVSIVYGNCSRSDVLRDSVTCVGFPFTGTLQQTAAGTPPTNEAFLETYNVQNDAMWWRYDTGLGKWANRCFRGLRDSWVAHGDEQYGNNVYTVGGGWVVPALPGTGATATQLLEAWLMWLAANTFQPVPTSPPSTSATLLAYTRVFYMKGGSHDTGKGYAVARARARAKI